MCKYDDMYVQILPHTTHQILKKRGPESPSQLHTSTYFKNALKNILETTRIWLLIYLLISPVSGGPLVRPSKSPRAASITVPFRHKGYPKVGIGIAPTTELAPQLSVEGEVSRSLNKYYSSSFSSLQALQELPNLRKQSVDSPRENSLEDIVIFSLEDNFGSSDQLSEPVPKSSGLESNDLIPNPVPTLKALDGRRSRSPPPSVVRLPKSSSHFQFSSMDEGDNSVVGRERRATAPTPSGGGHWMKPCPNLDSKVDETATPASLSTLILRAIHEAKSQVDKFINDFAREAFQVDSWQDSLVEHSDFSLAFLNNSSGIDLSSSAEITFPAALQEAYELMQRRAVGIEQVTLDQALYQASFLTEFRHVEDRIVHVLCELRYAMIQSAVTPKEDVTKDVMEEETRDMDGERRRNIRDAVILREYVTGLQTLNKLFNQFSTESH